MASVDLAEEMRHHLAQPFPKSVVATHEYGKVDPVMINAEVYGWAMIVHAGDRLTALDRARLEHAAADLEQSLSAFPAEARPYYERLLRIAHQVLTQA